MLRKKLGIDVISISEPVLDGMYGRLIEMIIEWQDEFYSYNLAQDVTRGMKTKAQNGGYQCRPWDTGSRTTMRPRKSFRRRQKLSG